VAGRIILLIKVLNGLKLLSFDMLLRVTLAAWITAGMRFIGKELSPVA